MRSGGRDLAMVGEEAERPGRLTEKQIKAIVDLSRTGLGTGEIEKLTGAGRATVHFYTKNIPRPDSNVPNEEKNETIATIPPQIIDLSTKERNTLRPPSSARAQVDLGMGIIIDYELIAILRGLAAQEGYNDFNSYIRNRLIPWAAAIKDKCPGESPQAFFKQYVELNNDFCRAAKQLIELKKNGSWPEGREYMIRIMQILGNSPAQIQKEISAIDEMVRVARSFSR